MTTTLAPDLTTADALRRGDRISYPCWTGATCEHLPRTISGIVEYPKTRVLYFTEGGFGVVDLIARVRKL